MSMTPQSWKAAMQMEPISPQSLAWNRQWRKRSVIMTHLWQSRRLFFAVSDGVITASQDGTLSYVAYAEGDTLKADTAVVLYSDNSTISISVEVPQEKITEVSVGEEVAVQISGNRMGTQTGTITSIASGATTGGSISNVTYAVVVTIDNTEGTLSAGSSAVVTFEMGE